MGMPVITLSLYNTTRSMAAARAVTLVVVSKPYHYGKRRGAVAVSPLGRRWDLSITFDYYLYWLPRWHVIETPAKGGRVCVLNNGHTCGKPDFGISPVLFALIIGMLLTFSA